MIYSQGSRKLEPWARISQRLRRTFTPVPKSSAGSWLPPASV